MIDFLVTFFFGGITTAAIFLLNFKWDNGTWIWRKSERPDEERWDRLFKILEAQSNAIIAQSSVQGNSNVTAPQSFEDFKASLTEDYFAELMATGGHKMCDFCPVLKSGTKCNVSNEKSCNEVLTEFFSKNDSNVDY